MNIFTFSHKGAALAFVTAVICASAPGSIAAETLNFGELVPGQEYSFHQGDEIIATYTPPAAGSVKMIFTGQDITAYTTPEHNTDDINLSYTFSWGANGTKVLVYNLAEGETLYFYSSSTQTIGDGTMTVGVKPTSISLIETSPSLDQGLFSCSTYYTISYLFDEPVQATSATLRYQQDGETKYVGIPMTVGNSSIDVKVSESLMNLYREGVISEGDEVTIRIVGVRSSAYDDVRYGSNGRLETKFKVAAKPAEIVSTTNFPDTGMTDFLSYYLPGDPAGIVSIEFDRELNANREPSVSLSYGNPEDLEHQMYFENLNYKYEGRKFSADLTGKLRRPTDMQPGISTESAQKVILLSIGDLYTSDGQRVYTASESAYTRFGIGYNIKVLDYVVATDFTPARGGQVKADTPVELWILNGTKCMFDGIDLTYTKEGQKQRLSLPKEQLDVKADPDDTDALLINFDMPDLGADPDTEVELDLFGLIFADGLDHSDNVHGYFKWNASSGIQNVDEAENATADVYSVDGIRVLACASEAQLRQLPAGLYIMNGRKVVVK